MITLAADGPAVPTSTVQLLQEMFERMVVAKDARQIERYYDPGFRLVTNGIPQDYADFAPRPRRGLPDRDRLRGPL